MTLPTNRTTANTAAEHVADHNTLHAEYNVPTHTHAYAPVPGAWTAPTLINSWVNFGGINQVAEYRLNGTDVEVRGLIKSGASGTIALQLPAGFRPLASTILQGVSQGGQASIVVATDGSVYITQLTGDVTVYTSLTGVRFSTL